MNLSMKYITTFSLFFCYFVYGVNFYVIGPTLIELAGLFHTTIEKIAFIYTMRSAGYTIGSLSGFLFNYLNRQLMFVVFLTTMGITLIVMPHCNSLTALFSLAGLNGFSIGSFDTAINVWLLEIWQEESGPYMQALHFTYGLGSFVAPLICEPFLSGESIYIDDDLDSNITMTNTSSSWNMTMNNTSNDYPIDEINPIDYLIYIPYTFAGGITIFGALLVLCLYIYKKYEPPTKYSQTNSSSSHSTQTHHQHHKITKKKGKKFPPFLMIWLVALGSLFLTFFVGMEQMHLQFLPTFAVNSDLNLSPSESALIASAAAAAFTVGRGLSIVLAIKLLPQTILYSNHILMFVGCVLLAIYANSSEVMMYLANIIIGCGFSSVYASIYAFLENHITVTNTIGSIFVFAGGLTASLSPSLVGHYIEANPLILVWFNLVCVSLCFILFLIIHLTSILSHQKHKQKQDSIESSSNQTSNKVIAA